MSDTTAAPTANDAKPDTTEGKPQVEDFKAKFEAQQKVNRDLEAKLNGVRDAQTKQTEALAGALGLKPQDAPDISVIAATVRTLSEQFEQTQRQNLVLSVANDHGIKDADAIADLASVQGEDAMRRMAARIAASNPTGSDTSTTSPGPRPDLTQGAQGTPAAGDPASQFGRFLQDQMNR